MIIELPDKIKITASWRPVVIKYFTFNGIATQQHRTTAMTTVVTREMYWGNTRARYVDQ